jgi:hypothetical protein
MNLCNFDVSGNLVTLLLLHHSDQTESNEVTTVLRADLEDVRSRLTGSMDQLGVKDQDTSGRVKTMELEIEEMMEKIYELDKSWKNNLVFYGVRCDEGKFNFRGICLCKQSFATLFYHRARDHGFM